MGEKAPQGTPRFQSRGRLAKRTGYAALLLIFVFAYLARYVPPHDVWWLQLFGPLTPYLSVVVMGASIGVFRRGRRKQRIVLGLILMLILWRFGPDALPLLTPAAEAHRDGLIPLDTLVVMSYNAKWKHPARQAALTDFLRREHPRVVAVQEGTLHFVGGTNYSGELIPFLKEGHYRLPSLETDSRNIVRHPLLSRTTGGSFSEIDLFPADSSRTSWIGRATLSVTGQAIVIYNVHLRSYLEHRPPSSAGFHALLQVYRTLREDVLTREQEARAIRGLLDAETRPFVLVGDFNATPHNWVYQHLSRQLQDAIRRGSRALFGTYPARWPLVRPDNIFASPQWEVLSARVGPALTSDHRTVLATLVLLGGA